MNLSQLLADYEAKNPRRATGGLRALSGFDYQLRLYLADYVEALTKGESLEGAGTNFTHGLEALSDFTSSVGRGWICVQVKRTLTQASIVAAAVEFAVIEEFLTSHGQPYGDTLPRYCVAGQRSDLVSDWSWDTVKLPTDIERKNPSLSAIWERIRLEERLDPPRTELDPWWRVIVATFDVLDRPFEFARRALEICLRRHEISAAQVRDRIAEYFTEMQRPVRVTPPRILTTEDFVPDSVETLKPLRVGYRPSLALVRGLQYMPRPTHVNDARRELERLLTLRDHGETYGLQVFWIKARSGTGKSVLLLQLMEEMVQRGQRTIWLEDDAAKVTSVLEAVRDELKLGSTEVPDILFVDDVYAPQSQEVLNLMLIERIIESRPFDRWPVVVTCGPPEFRDRMERDACGGAVRFHDWRLPLVCPAEADKFKSWYRSRTGEQPPTGKAFSETEGLMVSMAFEMRFEKRDANLEPFANRFGERLKASNLDEPLQIPLALNRLYLWTPTIWLTERVREQFDSLNKERDFSILELRASGEFLRLTHPHISDAIYRAVRYPMVGRAFANDLANALKMAAETHVPTLRLLMRTLSSVDERIKERLNDVDLQHLAKRAAADWITERVEVKISETDALADLRVSWSCWHAQHPELALEVLLGRTPGQLIDEARQALDSSRATWPFLWRRLDSAFQNHAGLAVDALDWLFLPSSQTSRSWSFIWERVWDLSHIYPKLIDMLLLVRGAEAWLNQNAEQRTWHYIWKKLLEASRCASPILTTESVLARGWKWAIESADWHVRADHPAWTFVWQDLLSGFQRTSDQRNVLLLRGYDWLVEHEEYGGWPYVWDRLTNEKDLPAEISRVDLLLRGYDWLAERERWNQWGFVCERLLKSPEARHIPEVRERVVPWLIDSENQARAEWDKLLEHYLDAGGRDKTALNCAIEWIWKNLDKPQVPPFAAKILSVCENRRELDDLARWLSSWICVHQNNSQLPFLAGSLHPLLSEQELTSLPGWAALLKSLAAQPFIDSIIFAQLSRSKAFAADGRLEEALAELRQVADRAKTALDWYALAVSYGKTGCHEECVRAARKATEMEPEDPKYWRCLAIGLDNLGRNKKEVIEVRIRIAELTDTGLDWYALAVYYGKVGNSEEAVRAAQKAIEKEPLHSEYWCRLAVELANVPGNQKEARQARNRAAELAMTADNWQAISVANQRAGLYEPAIEAADKAIAIAPEHVEAWRSRAVNLDQIGRPDEAILAWKSVDELAGVATRMTTVDEALNDVQTNPKSMDAWRRLAYVYRRVGQASEAVSIARSAVELTPHIAFATIAVAEDLMSVLPEAVIGLVEDLIVLDPQNGNYLHLLGAARRKAGDLNGAVDALRKACSLDPKRPNYWYALGKALEDLRTLDEARIAYEKAVELKATYAKARRALERLTS